MALPVHDFAIPFPALGVVRGAVAGVWLYEGLWCKILGRAPLQVQVVAAVPRFGTSYGLVFLKMLGALEIALAAWVISGIAPGACAIAETTVLVLLNANGIMWARHIIHEPAGMIVKNLAFLVLAWVCGAIPGGKP